MGSSVAAAAQRGGCRVYWASAGRSAQTRARAEEVGLHDAGTLAALCAACDVMVSVCPPHAAEEVARQVAGCRFVGLYLDANAISPERARRIAGVVEAAGAAFVDGGIVGPPAWHRDTTWLYLSGERGDEAAACFAGSVLDTAIVGREPGLASALKMCYAAWTKGTTALLCAILLAAHELEVWDVLAVQWARDWPGFDEEAVRRARRVTAKAWRFAGEMDEIAATFEAAGAPAGFHEAAAGVYRRLAQFKEWAEDPGDAPALADVLDALRAGDVETV
jgi:3-hydroxyisobutyrate dehydrogenase-like beta-hydroxyacid dehydrogenase